MKCDVTNEVEVNKVINEIYELEGKIDILINNAGMWISCNAGVLCELAL